MPLSPHDWRELASVFREGANAWPPHWTEGAAFSRMADRCEEIAAERNDLSRTQEIRDLLCRFARSATMKQRVAYAGQ